VSGRPFIHAGGRFSMGERVQVRVSGRVQGVGYRYFTQHTAAALGVLGSVRNLPEGEVEAIAEGSKEKLEEFVQALREGPHAGHVDDVTEAWSEPTGEFSTFEVVA